MILLYLRNKHIIYYVNLDKFIKNKNYFIGLDQRTKRWEMSMRTLNFQPYLASPYFRYHE